MNYINRVIPNKLLIPIPSIEILDILYKTYLEVDSNNKIDNYQKVYLLISKEIIDYVYENYSNTNKNYFYQTFYKELLITNIPFYKIIKLIIRLYMRYRLVSNKEIKIYLSYLIKYYERRRKKHLQKMFARA